MIRRLLIPAALLALAACSASPTAPRATAPALHDDTGTFGGGAGLVDSPPPPPGDNSGFLGSGN